MSSISGISNNYQTQNTMQKDFQNFRTNLNSLQSALNSGNQDQVTLSETALSQAATELQSDFSGVTQGQSAGNSNSVQSTGNSNTQNFQNDLQTLQTALNSATSNQGTSSQNSVGNALNQVESDLSSMKGHGHHHHHMGSGSSSSDASGTSSSSATSSNGIMSQLLNMLDGNTSSTSSTSGGNSISSLASLLGASNGNTTNLASIFGTAGSGQAQSIVSGILA